MDSDKQELRKMTQEQVTAFSEAIVGGMDAVEAYRVIFPFLAEDRCETDAPLVLQSRAIQGEMTRLRTRGEDGVLADELMLMLKVGDMTHKEKLAAIQILEKVNARIAARAVQDSGDEILLAFLEEHAIHVSLN